MKIKFLAGISVLACTVLVFCSPRKKAEDGYYTCTMHPQVKKSEPGLCPICGMKLVFVKNQPPGTAGEIDHSQHEKGDGNENKEQSVFIDAAGITAGGIRVTTAEVRELKKIIRSPGRVAYDPELFQAIIEFQQLVNSASAMDALGSQDDLNATNLSRSARNRLRQLGLSNAEISSVTRADPAVFILGGQGGTTIVYSQVYENDLASVRSGQAASVKVSAYPGKIFKGKILGLSTILDEKNRSLRVRTRVSDPQKLLKPQMFADVEIAANFGKVLTVPKSAVLHAGDRDVVYVQLKPGHFGPRQVLSGLETDEFVEIKSGLKDQEEVVFAGTFLIDSEARLKLGDKTASPHEGHGK